MCYQGEAQPSGFRADKIRAARFLISCRKHVMFYQPFDRSMGLLIINEFLNVRLLLL